MNTLTEKEQEELRENLLNKIEEYVLKYHVSLGNYLGSSELPPPIGSGTFVKFNTLTHVVYGILTAAHVVKDLKFGLLGQPAFIGLSKLQNGDTIACSVSFQYIYACVEIEGFHSESDDGVAFTAVQNMRSRAVMERIGMHRDPKDDFDHPKLSKQHRLSKHVLYRLEAEIWQKQNNLKHTNIKH